ncbi:MAG: hypothetical protein ABIZ52_00240 [Candidatus Limnocylindrales bacterium]
MELLLFIAIGFGVLVYLARERFGRGADSAARRAKEGEPIGYGEFVSPKGTSPGASVNVGWFGRTHENDGAGRGGTSASE